LIRRKWGVAAMRKTDLLCYSFVLPRAGVHLPLL
jgi:hypothetical protein